MIGPIPSAVDSPGAVIRALDAKGRLQLPIDAGGATKLPAERDGALVTVFLPGSPERPRPSFVTAALPLDARGRVAVTAGVRREAGIADGADVLAVVHADDVLPTPVGDGHACRTTSGSLALGDGGQPNERGLELVARRRPGTGSRSAVSHRGLLGRSKRTEQRADRY